MKFVSAMPVWCGLTEIILKIVLPPGFACIGGKVQSVMDKLKRLLALEAKYQLRSEFFDELLSGGSLVKLNTYEPMIDAGEFNPDIYVVKEGLVRGTYLDKNSEKTAGFALPGTLFMSLHCYYGNEPSYYRFEACCSTEVIRIPRQWFDGMTARYHEFALWVMSANQNQLYYNEFRSHLLSGDAKSRFEQLTQRVSKIIPEVPSDVIASGLGVGKSHYDKVKTEMYTRWKMILPIVPSKIIASYLGITEQHLSKIKRELLRDGMERGQR